MKREELKCPVVDEYYGDGEYETHTDKYYYKDEADSVMDAYERRIARLTKCVEMWHKVNEDLQSNNTHLRKRVKELEAAISKMETTTPKWVSVEDVLPQWGKLVKIKFKDGKEDERRFSADYKWVSKGVQTCESVNVTHWMPLPPPPETEEK